MFPTEDLLHMFLLRYYDATTSIPHEVIVRVMPEDAEAMEQWLTGKLASAHGAKVRISRPGTRRESGSGLHGRDRTPSIRSCATKCARTTTTSASTMHLLQLESALALDAPPMRIECFDISTNHGTYTVASMVVFTNGRPDKGQYRRFKIKAQLDEANDFLSMQEVMSRRLLRRAYGR